LLAKIPWRGEHCPQTLKPASQIVVSGRVGDLALPFLVLRRSFSAAPRYLLGEDRCGLVAKEILSELGRMWTEFTVRILAPFDDSTSFLRWSDRRDTMTEHLSSIIVGNGMLT
jgi:hypothetical protein